MNKEFDEALNQARRQFIYRNYCELGTFYDDNGKHKQRRCKPVPADELVDAIEKFEEVWRRELPDGKL